MARGTTLTELLVMLRAEAGHSTSVAAGADNQNSQFQKLRRTQTLLYDGYDWPFMMDEWPIEMQAGERYYDFPVEAGFPGGTVVNLESTIEMWVDYSGRPVPLGRGIGVRQYASQNSNNGERGGPVRRWDVKRVDDTREMIEVWPIPSDGSCTLWLKGKKKLRPLIAPSDVADLDDYLIVLTCAAEILARQKSADAGAVADAAKERLAQLKIDTKGSTGMVNMAGPNNRTGNNFGKTIIRIGSQTN